MVQLHVAPVGRTTLTKTTMDTETITTTARATFDGTLSFKEVVGNLLSAGVEYYHVDLIGLGKTFFGAHGDVVLVGMPMDHLPDVAHNFDGAALRENIRDSQHHGQSYREFVRRAMQAGCMGYYAFLRGQRVTYLGRQGDQHTEWFPGAEPIAAGRAV